MDQDAPSAKDLELVNEVLKSHGDDPKDEVVWSAWCDISFDLEKGKFARKLMAVSKFRVVIMKQGFFGKLGVEKDLHLLDISCIQEQGGKLMVFETWKKDCEFGVKTSAVTFMLRSIRAGYRWMSTGIREGYKMKVNVYRELLEPLNELPKGEISGGCGIINSYLACCNYLNKKKKDALVHYLHDISEREIVDVNLDDCPGHMSSSELSVDFHPLFMALAHNNFFLSVISEYVTLDQQSVEGLGTAMLTNNRMTRLEIVGAGITDISPIGLALQHNNNFHQLSIINFSKNNLSDRGVIALATALESCTIHGLQVLNLSDCKLSGRALQALFDSFYSNLFLSLSIQALYIGGNDFSEAASQSMIKWMRRGQQQFQLERLSFAKATSVNLDLILGAVAYATCRLRWLDLSGIRISDNEIPALEAFLPSLRQKSRLNVAPEVLSLERDSIPDPRLSIGLPSYALVDDDDDLPSLGALPSDKTMSIILRQCQLSMNVVVESLVPFLKKHTDLDRISLDLSGNDITNSGLTILTQLLSDAHQFKTLRIADMKLRPRTVYNFLTRPPPSIVRLDLSGTLNGTGSPSSQELNELSQSLVSFLSSSKTLECLTLSNNKSHFTAKVLEPALQVLQSNQSAPIRFLDLSENSAGDLLAHHLASLIRVNKIIQSLRIDGNGFQLSGYQSIYSGMLDPANPNTTLWDLPLPASDILKASKQIPNSRKAAFLNMIANLKSILDRNTPTHIIKSQLAEALSMTPLNPWPSVLEVTDANLAIQSPPIIHASSANQNEGSSSDASLLSVDAATGASSGDSLTTPRRNSTSRKSRRSSLTIPTPTSTIPSLPPTAPSLPHDSNPSFNTLINPRATLKVNPFSTPARRISSLGMGTMSRSSVIFTQAMLSDIDISELNLSNPSPRASTNQNNYKTYQNQTISTNNNNMNVMNNANTVIPSVVVPQVQVIPDFSDQNVPHQEEYHDQNLEYNQEQ